VSVYERLDSLNITLPDPTPPVAAFVPFLRSGNLLFSSGHIAKIGGKPWVGQLGATWLCGPRFVAEQALRRSVGKANSPGEPDAHRE